MEKNYAQEDIRKSIMENNINKFRLSHGKLLMNNDKLKKGIGFL